MSNEIAIAICNLKFGDGGMKLHIKSNDNIATGRCLSIAKVIYPTSIKIATNEYRAGDKLSAGHDDIWSTSWNRIVSDHVPDSSDHKSNPELRSGMKIREQESLK